MRRFALLGVLLVASCDAPSRIPTTPLGGAAASPDEIPAYDGIVGRTGPVADASQSSLRADATFIPKLRPKFGVNTGLGTTNIMAPGIAIVPMSPTFVSNCIPFGANIGYGFSGFIYRNVPAFSMVIGDKIRFDLGRLNDVDVRRNIYFSAANLNPGPAPINQGMAPTGWVQVVSDAQIPANPKGNTVQGDYELTYTAQANFNFAGGGFFIGFGGSPPGAYVDGGCEQVLVRTTFQDVSGHFYRRFYSMPNLPMFQLDGCCDNVELGGFRIDPGAPANQPPTAAIAGPGQAPEGSGITLDANGSSDPNHDQLHFAWKVNGVPSGSDAPLLNVQVGDGPATLTVTVTVTDGKGGSATATHLVTVNNVAPTGTLSAQSPVNEGQSFAMSFAGVNDPSAADVAAIVQAAFDCGGGYGAFSNALTTSCPTTDNGTRSVRGKLRDKDGGTTEFTASVTVNNVAPTVNAGADQAITSGQTAMFSGTFTDPGVNDAPWSYAWNFAGGTGSTNTLGGPIPGNLQFCTAGSFTVTLAVTDKDGGTGTDQLALTVNRVTVAIRVLPEAINLQGDRQNAGNGRGGGAASGMVIVHVYSSGDFDATQLDPASLRLTNGSGAGTPAATRNNGTFYFQTDADVNGDGRPDAVIHFNRADLITNGDLTSATTQLMLLGTEGACRNVRGVDDVRVVH